MIVSIFILSKGNASKQTLEKEMRDGSLKGGQSRNGGPRAMKIIKLEMQNGKQYWRHLLAEEHTILFSKSTGGECLYRNNNPLLSEYVEEQLHHHALKCTQDEK